MEYYDHNSGQNEPRGGGPGYRDYRDQYGSYRTSFMEGNNTRDIRQYRDYRNNYYRGRGDRYYPYNRRGGRGHYRGGDRDFRDDREIRSDLPSQIRDGQECSNSGEGRPYQASGFDSDDRSGSENEEGIHIGAERSSKKSSKRSKRTHHASHYEGDSSSSISDDMELEKELYPISHYLETDDREEMLIQVFKVIRGPKLRAMLTSVLKDIDLTELKLLCLEQLEGMSKKRIRAILAGQEMEDSSATEDEEDGEKEDNNEDKTSEGEDHQIAKAQHKKEDNVKNVSQDDIESGNLGKVSDPTAGLRENKLKTEEKLKKKHAAKHVLGNMSGVVQFKSGGRPAGKLRGTDSRPGASSSESSGEDLENVIASGNAERKRKHELKEKITKTKKIGFKVGKRTKVSMISEEKQHADENDVEGSTETDKSGKTLMELLELEMRARAIKALLGTKEIDLSGANNENDNEQATNNELEINKETGKDLKGEEVDEEEVRKQMEEEKRLQKAREHLHISEAKKREEEEVVERKHAEIRMRLEEQQKLKDAEELQAKRRSEEEAEKKRKVQKKQEDYEKFLMWKEERRQKKDEKKRFELQRQKEDEWYTRQAVLEKERQMLDKEKRKADERVQLIQTTELKRNKIDRVDVTEGGGEVKDQEKSEDDVEDDLNRQFEITFSHGDVTMDTAEVDSTAEEKPDKIHPIEIGSELKVTNKEIIDQVKVGKKRRYRRKIEDEEGQLPSDDESLNAYDLGKELGSDNSFSEEKNSSGSDTSLSSPEPSEGDENEMDDKKIEMIRRRRAEIRRRNRRRKPAADIEEGEVDSDGEHFEPMEESKDPKVRMILHHLPKRTRAKKKLRTEKDSKNSEGPTAEAAEDQISDDKVVENSDPAEIGSNKSVCDENDSKPIEQTGIDLADEKTDIARADNQTVVVKNKISEGEDNNESMPRETKELISNENKTIRNVSGTMEQDLEMQHNQESCNVDGDMKRKADVLSQKTKSSYLATETATNQQKIEISRPVNDPVLLEARRAFLESKPREEQTKAVHPLRSSDSEEPSDNDEGMEETFEERAERKRKDKEERKRKKKIADQRAKRFKRMQAFQARSDMQNFMDVEHTSEDDADMRDKTDMEHKPSTEEGSEDGEVVDEGGNFYKSYNDLEETEKKRLDEAKSVGEQLKAKEDKEREEQEERDGEQGLMEKCYAAKETPSSTTIQPAVMRNKSEFDGSGNQEVPHDRRINDNKDEAITDKNGEINNDMPDAAKEKETLANRKKRKPKEKKKSPEEAQMEGVGFWARMCESQGDFEVPDTKCEAHDNHPSKKEPSRRSKGVGKSAAGKSDDPTALRHRGKGNQDRPSKEQVDKQQEEMEGLTWADRWYENKQVQKVVKHSQLLSKVRSNIKIKLRGPDGLADKITNVSSSASGNVSSASPASGEATTSEPGSKVKLSADGTLPESITGSMKEYAKIVGKTTEQIEREQLEELEKNSDVEDSDEEVEAGDDDLWGAIMGKKE